MFIYLSLSHCLSISFSLFTALLEPLAALHLRAVADEEFAPVQQAHQRGVLAALLRTQVAAAADPAPVAHSSSLATTAC